MKQEHQESVNVQNSETSQEALMNKVNQTFEQIVQDVKHLMDENTKKGQIE